MKFKLFPNFRQSKQAKYLYSSSRNRNDIYTNDHVRNNFQNNFFMVKSFTFTLQASVKLLIFIFFFFSLSLSLWYASTLFNFKIGELIGIVPHCWKCVLFPPGAEQMGKRQVPCGRGLFSRTLGGNAIQTEEARLSLGELSSWLTTFDIDAC